MTNTLTSMALSAASITAFATSVLAWEPPSQEAALKAYFEQQTTAIEKQTFSGIESKADWLRKRGLYRLLKPPLGVGDQNFLDIFPHDERNTGHLFTRTTHCDER